jgi:hypothetical protein
LPQKEAINIMSDTSDRISLKAAIAGLRDQLRAAASEAQHLGPGESKFRIRSVELELTVAAEDSVGMGAEVGWWVFKAKADIGNKDIITHKVKLTLDVGDIEVSSKTRTR